MKEIDYADTETVKLVVTSLDRASSRWNKYTIGLLVTGIGAGFVTLAELGIIALANTAEAAASTHSGNFELQAGVAALVSTCTLAASVTTHARSQRLTKEADDHAFNWASTPISQHFKA